MKKSWEVVLTIFATILSLIVGYNNLYIISDLNFSYQSLKSIFYFIFLIFFVFLASKQLPEAIYDLIKDVIIPPIKKEFKRKYSTSKGKFELILGILGVIYIYKNVILYGIENQENIFMNIIIIIGTIIITYKLFSNLRILFGFLFIIFSMDFIIDLFGIGSSKEELIVIVLIFPFIFGLSIFFSGKFEKGYNYIFGIKSTEKSQEDIT